MIIQRRSAAAAAAAAAATRRFGIAFDIDGVLLKSKHPIPGSPEAIRAVQSLGIPHVFLTNGGGVLESAKADELTRALAAPVAQQSVILSHTPLRSLVHKYADRRVLVLGCRDSLAVARKYGLHRAIGVDEYCGAFPDAYPFKKFPAPAAWGAAGGPDAMRSRNVKLSDGRSVRVPDEPVEAIMVFHDPIDWAVECQVCCDVVRGGSPAGAGRMQAIPVYHTNSDLVFSSSYPVPRFAAGAFIETFANLHMLLTGQQLHVTRYGKPHNVTFNFAWSRLETLASLLRSGESVAAPRELPVSDEHIAPPSRPSLERLYMIGDNPAADIRGANAAGKPWISVLVRTGVYGSDAPTSDTDQAQLVFDDANTAVREILLRELGAAALPSELKLE